MNSNTTIQSFYDHLIPFLHTTKMEKNFVIMDVHDVILQNKHEIGWMIKKLIMFLMVGNLSKH